MKALFISSVPSPFQVELARAIRDRGVDYQVAFLDSLQDRGKHWLEGTEASAFVHVPPADGWQNWLAGLILQQAPDAVICGYARGPVFRVVAQAAHAVGSQFGLWLEELRPMPGPVYALKKAFYRQLWLRSGCDFILAIGDKACREYQGILGRGLDVAMLPYAQDLGPSRAIPDRRLGSPTVFLFSGRLLPRNNIVMMARAFRLLVQTHKGQFGWTISGHGPEENRLQRMLRAWPELAAHVRFDREFSRWEDRLRPMAESDVLVVTPTYSGWGLVIPEAMAAGRAVIASHGMASARYFISHMQSGILIDPSVQSLYEVLASLVERPALIERLGRCARRAISNGEAATVAMAWVDFLEGRARR